MKKYLFLLLGLMVLLILGCSGGSDSTSSSLPDIVVNSLADLANPASGTVTLRSALASAQTGQTIVFDDSLDGETLELSIIGEDHSILKGEVMGMRIEPSGWVSYLVGYLDRDYGKSALYARKNVSIDASDLPSGITLEWTGGDANPARVLAVYGDLTLINVSITGGRIKAEDISTGDPDDQPWTLARGGAVAVWGRAFLTDCRLYNNHCSGDYDSSRDRGAYGGGIYADILAMKNCVVSGNSIIGAGAAGGGVYSEGGAGLSDTVSRIEGSTISGNKIRSGNTYGGGVFSNGGGIGNLKTLEIVNCTIAQNKVQEPEAGVPPFESGVPDSLMNSGYWRGGGVYMSNGYLKMTACTVAENEVYGKYRINALGKSNMAGGIAATIGNAHAAEEINIAHCILAGNRVIPTVGSPYEEDIFTGSLLYFQSRGFNRIGVVNFDQILVPVGEPNWESLCRKHYPKQGDQDGVDVADVLNLTTGVTHATDILSVGVNEGGPAVLYYAPAGNALNQVPASYSVTSVFAEYAVQGGEDNFLAIFLDRVEDYYGLTGFAVDFTTDFEAFLLTLDSDAAALGNQPYQDPSGNDILTLEDTLWFGPAVTWPKEIYNYPYIHFWHRFDQALEAEGIAGMGQELLGDDQWEDLFTSGPLTENPSIVMKMTQKTISPITPRSPDQTGRARPAGTLADIGAIEIP
ncbi:MAG: hypothetical protein FP816_05745 [Desulfobacteraceae bacterium]|nr:hypothetical protein [Desulfobacteraceae bacterium]